MFEVEYNTINLRLIDAPHDISATVYLKQKNQSVFDLV